MKLYLTPLSHFARKVRIVIEYYELDIDYVDVRNVTDIGIEKYADNPLMGVPVLSGENIWLIESDNIISYLIEQNDNEDKLKFKTKDLNKLNMRALLNGLMLNEVKIVQGKRSGIAIDDFAYFKKAKASMEATLSWLERSADQFETSKLNFDNIHLVCAIEHIKFFQTMPLDRYAQINRIVEEMGRHSIVEKTSPFRLGAI